MPFSLQTHTPYLYCMWSQWGRCAVFGRCFFLILICGHWKRQIIDTWVVGSDARAELINVSLIRAVLALRRLCLCLSGRSVSASVHSHVPHVVCMWMSAHDFLCCKLLWMQPTAELYATQCNTLSDNYLRCATAHRNLSFISNYCFPEVERDRGREGQGEEEIYALWRQRSTHTNGS